MVLPGIQALFGFQLMAVFNNRFQELTLYEQYIHFSSILLVVIVHRMLIMTPAAYHRLVERGTVSQCLYRFILHPDCQCHDPLNVGNCTGSATRRQTYSR